VLWVTKGLGPGGAERLLVELARAHSDAVHLKAAYVLPWKDHLVADLEAAGVASTCLSTRRSDPRWPLRLRRMIATGDIDVVHAHSPLMASAARLARATLPKSARPQIVTTEHNSWTTYHPLTRWANRLTGRWDSATIAVSDEAAASVRGAAASRVQTLVHGIDVAAHRALTRSSRAAVRTELGLGDDALVIITVANYRRQKDYPNLIEAFRSLIAQGIDAHLVAVGQGPLADEVRTLVDNAGLTERVILTGYRPDAARLMAAADVFSLASAWEGLPVALMEALAAGLPVVASAVGGVAEALRSPDDAILVPAGDPAALASAWAAVLSDPIELRRLAARSLAIADRYDVGRAAATLEATYTNIVRPIARPGDNPAHVRPRSPKRSAALPIRPMTDDDLDQVLALGHNTLGWQDRDWSRQLFQMKHVTNPFGRSIGLVAVDGERIAAVRVLMRWEFQRGERVLRAVRAVDTATHPDYQRRGLFESLTYAALGACADDGIDFVFNTPNTQSMPGYLKMGWRQVGRLPTAIHPREVSALSRLARERPAAELRYLDVDGGLSIDEWIGSGGWAQVATDRSAVDTSDRTLRTRLDADVLRWRYGNATMPSRVFVDGPSTVIVSLRRRGDATEAVINQGFGPASDVDTLACSVARRVDAAYAVRLGGPSLRHRFLPVPGGGPWLTWRAVSDAGMPPLPNWALTMGDIASF